MCVIILVLDPQSKQNRESRSQGIVFHKSQALLSWSGESCLTAYFFTKHSHRQANPTHGVQLVYSVAPDNLGVFLSLLKGVETSWLHCYQFFLPRRKLGMPVKSTDPGATLYTTFSMFTCKLGLWRRMISVLIDPCLIMPPHHLVLGAIPKLAKVHWKYVGQIQNYRHWFLRWIHISKSADVYYVSHGHWTASAHKSMWIMAFWHPGPIYAVHP